MYASTNIIREIRLKKMRREGHVARIREMRNIYKILIGKPKRILKDNIRMYLREIRREVVDWMDLA
jgi:hypothetical protein